MLYWKVIIEDHAELQLTILLKEKKITKDDIKVLLRWVFEMEENGPDFIKNSSEWYDHALEREWQGYRSSAFSYSGRIIYKVIENKILVKVAKVTIDHNYKK